jgi:hypothetical protein
MGSHNSKDVLHGMRALLREGIEARLRRGVRRQHCRELDRCGDVGCATCIWTATSVRGGSAAGLRLQTGFQKPATAS